jgi:hypothetical protein
MRSITLLNLGRKGLWTMSKSFDNLAPSKSLTYSGIAYERTSQIIISIDQLPENEIRCPHRINDVPIV